MTALTIPGTTPLNQPILARRDPSSGDTIGPDGSVIAFGRLWINISVSPARIFVYGGAGVWQEGGNPMATTTTPGIVLLDLTIDGSSTDDTVPTNKAVFDYGQSLVLAGASLANETTIGITELSTDAEAVAGTSLLPATPLAVQPSNLAAVFAAPPSGGFGSTTPRPVAATNLSASGTFALTGDQVQVAEGGTGLSSLTAGSLLFGAGTSPLDDLPIGNPGEVLQVNAGGDAPEWTDSLDLAGTLDVTGAATFDDTVTVDGAVTINDALTIEQLDVDNLRLDGNTISSTNTNGALNLIPHGTGAVNIATGADANVVTMGTADGASAINLVVGTGNFSLNGAASSNYTLGAATTTGTISIGGTSQTGTGTLFGGDDAQTINIANSTGGKTVNIATGAGANTVTLGSTNTTSATVINAGSGGNTIVGDVEISTGDLDVTLGDIATAAGSITSATTLTATLGDITATDGNVVLEGAATQIEIEGGAATDFIGTGTLTAGVATILNTNIKATDRIFLQRISPGASTAIGFLSYAINAGTSFVVTSLDATASTETDDGSTFSYVIINEL